MKKIVLSISVFALSLLAISCKKNTRIEAEQAITPEVVQDVAVDGAAASEGVVEAVNDVTKNLSQNTNDFLRKHFANVGITEAKSTTDGFEVKLASGMEIDFDINGNPVSIDGNDQKIPEAIIPNGILNYVNANLPGQFITDYEFKNNQYKIELNNNKEFKFDSKQALLK